MPRKRSYKRYLERNAVDEDLKVPLRTLCRWKKKNYGISSDAGSSSALGDDQHLSLSDSSISIGGDSVGSIPHLEDKGDDDQHLSLSDSSISIGGDSVGSIPHLEDKDQEMLRSWEGMGDFSDSSESLSEYESDVSSGSSFNTSLASHVSLNEGDDSGVQPRNRSISSCSEVNEVEDLPQENYKDESNMDIFKDMYILIENGFTKREILLMALSYSFRHNLSITAVEDLLKLLSIVLRSEMLPVSKYLLKKLIDANSSINRHYVCDVCSSVIKTVKFNSSPRIEEMAMCKKCQKDISLLKADLFLTIPIEQQLRNLLSNTELGKYVANRNMEENEGLSDISDGKAYRHMAHSYQFGKTDLTLTINTDGVPAFKSSSSSIWPIMVTVNELPPYVRDKEVLLTGVWFARREPNMNTFLEPVISEILSLKEGFQWHCNGKYFKSRVFLLCCCVDSVARAKVLKMKQHNGYHGCPWCYHPGVLQKSAGNPNGVIRYPASTGRFRERTDEEIRRDMRKAETTKNIILGVRGNPILTTLTYLDIVGSVVPDYMHCVLLGLVRKLVNLWTNSSNHLKDYYIGAPSTLTVLNERLTSIRVPRKIRRMPREMTERKHWKASEWKSFLLYYSLPVLTDILPRIYLDHLALLVDSIYLLLKSNIHVEILKEAQGKLLKFVEENEKLYGVECMTYNMHQLIHLGRSVEDMGPLWAHSAFPFENFNGVLLKDVHCAKGVAHQIVSRNSLRKSLARLAGDDKNIKYDVKEFVSRMSSFCAFKYSAETVGEYNLFSPQRNVLEHLVLPMDNLNLEMVFHKMIYRGEVFIAREGERANKRNDSFIVTGDGKIFEIHFIGKCENKVIFGGYFWKTIKHVNNVSHILQVSRLDEIQCISVEEYVEKCFVYKCNDTYYATTFPNNWENE